MEDRIIRLKEEGINYDEELLQKLLTVINLQNSLQLNLQLNPPNSVEMIRILLENIKDKEPQNKIIPVEFTSNFLNLLDRYSFKQDEGSSNELRSFKNYLDAQNNILNDRIKRFIKNNSTIKKSQIQKVFNCLDNINSFLPSGDDIYTSSVDETTYKMMHFIRNSMRNIIDIFPNIILNKVNYNAINIPKHWKLSQRHNKDLKDIITLYYKNLKQFYGSDLQDILTEIQSSCKDIYELAMITPYFATLRKMMIK